MCSMDLITTMEWNLLLFLLSDQESAFSENQLSYACFSATEIVKSELNCSFHIPLIFWCVYKTSKSYRNSRSFNLRKENYQHSLRELQLIILSGFLTNAQGNN